MRPFPKLSRSARAFTLIELLIVITIIAILAGVLFPVLNQVKGTALKTTARNDCMQLVNAINTFRMEYGRFPLASATTTDPPAFETDLEFMKILLAEESPGDGESALNSRGIVLFEGKIQQRVGAHGIDEEGNLFDPWGNLYEIRIDGNYDKKVDDFVSSGEPIRKTVIVRSSGPDGVFESADGAGGGGGGDSKIKVDDMKSWK